MNSKYQFSLSSTEPIEQSSTHWQLGWLKTVRLDLPLFHYWREWVRRECGMLSRWEQSCNTGMIEAVIIVPRTELGGNSIQTAKSGRKSIELSSCSGDHSPTYIVWLSWELNLRRQVWWDLPCRRWTKSSWNKTGSSTWIALHHFFIPKPRADELECTSMPKSKQRNPQQFVHGLNVRNWLHEAQVCFQGPRSIDSSTVIFPWMRLHDPINCSYISHDWQPKSEGRTFRSSNIQPSSIY